MSIRVHLILMRFVFPLGMLGGFLSVPLTFWFVTCVGRLLAPAQEDATRVVASVVTLAWFFLAVHGGGMIAVILVGRFLPARCPQCGRRAVTVTFVSADRGVYGCHKCGYVHPSPGDRAQPVSPPAGAKGPVGEAAAPGTSIVGSSDSR